MIMIGTKIRKKNCNSIIYIFVSNLFLKTISSIQSIFFCNIHKLKCKSKEDVELFVSKRKKIRKK